MMAKELWVNGQWMEAEGQHHYTVLNPATETALEEVADASPADVDRAINSAQEAFRSGVWSALPLSERSQRLENFAKLISQHAEDLVHWESLQAGKTKKLVTYSDLPFAVDNLRFFAAVSRVLEGAATGEYNGAHTSWIRRQPIGIVAGITPWNYPLLIALWKIGPALAAGNTMVLKPAPETPITTLMLGPLAKEAGIPDGVLNIVTGRDGSVGHQLVVDPRVRMISFTGSTATGRTIMANAAPRVKRLHLELGGKAPAIVRADANIAAAARGIAVGALVNTGQDCTAATRAYVHRSVWEPFLTALSQRFEATRLGDPLEMSTDIGPLISAKQRDKVQRYVDEAVAMGATLVTGGHATTINDRGYYFEPTILTDVQQDWPVVQEEVFGPVLVVMPFDTDEEAVTLANDVAYGLASSVWTESFSAATILSKQLEFGEVWINDHLPLTSEMPHGGVKQSGYGQDLSLDALNDFTVVKHVMADTSGVAEKDWHFTVLGDPPTE